MRSFMRISLSFVGSALAWWSPARKREAPYSTGFYSVRATSGIFSKGQELIHPQVETSSRVPTHIGGNVLVSGLSEETLLRIVGKIHQFENEVLTMDGGMSHEEVHADPGTVSVQRPNCEIVLQNGICRNSRAAASSRDEVAAECYLDLDEDPLLSEYIFSKLADTEGLGSGVVSLSPKTPAVCTDVVASSDRKHPHPLFTRTLVFRSPGPSLAEYFKTAPVTKDRYIIATRMFIQSLHMLKMLHHAGLVHGNLSDENIRFYELSVPTNLVTEDAYLVFSDFSKSRFYPNELGTKSLIHENIWPIESHSSLFELRGHRYGRRDDIYRLFETYMGWMIGDVFWQDMEVFANMDKQRQIGKVTRKIAGIEAKSRLELVKRDLDFFKTKKEAGRVFNVLLDFDADFKREVNGNKQLKTILERPYLEKLESLLGDDDKFHLIIVRLTRMLNYVRGKSGYVQGPVDGGVKTTGFLDQDDMGVDLVIADSNPSYRWLAQMAKKIEGILLGN